VKCLKCSNLWVTRRGCPVCGGFDAGSSRRSSRMETGTRLSTWRLCLSRPEPIRQQDAYVPQGVRLLRRSSASWLRRTCGNPFVPCRATAGELDGSRQRGFDHAGITPSAGEHRVRTTMRRREVGAGNDSESRVRADRSSARPATESEPIGDRDDKLSTRVPSSGGFHRQRQTNRDRVSILLSSRS
jgi:hypothetical protein